MPRWREIVFWLLALAAFPAAQPSRLIINEIAIVALFALSLDLILGYAGIVSLGHAAFFGMGAYSAGAVRQACDADPLVLARGRRWPAARAGPGDQLLSCAAPI